MNTAQMSKIIIDFEFAKQYVKNAGTGLKFYEIKDS